jgi:hypothetical protein
MVIYVHCDGYVEANQILEAKHCEAYSLSHFLLTLEDSIPKDKIKDRSSYYLCLFKYSNNKNKYILQKIGKISEEDCDSTKRLYRLKED